MTGSSYILIGSPVIENGLTRAGQKQGTRWCLRAPQLLKGLDGQTDSGGFVDTDTEAVGQMRSMNGKGKQVWLLGASPEDLEGQMGAEAHRESFGLGTIHLPFMWIPK